MRPEMPVIGERILRGASSTVAVANDDVVKCAATIIVNSVSVHGLLSLVAEEERRLSCENQQKTSQEKEEEVCLCIQSRDSYGGKGNVVVSSRGIHQHQWRNKVICSLNVVHRVIVGFMSREEDEEEETDWRLEEGTLIGLYYKEAHQVLHSNGMNQSRRNQERRIIKDLVNILQSLQNWRNPNFFN